MLGEVPEVSWLNATKCFTKGGTILGRHDIVNNGIDGRGNIVANPGQIGEVFVGRSEPFGIQEVDVT